VVDAPNGGGKIPLLPDYKLSHADGTIVLRNYQHRRFTYHEGADVDHATGGICRMCGTEHGSIPAWPAPWKTKPEVNGYADPLAAGSEARAP